MDKLEQYLDQVCRSIGGPRSLRQHVRQELRLHVRDAAAEHQAAGLSEEEALNRALEDFGGPEQVRSELEATHGYRLLPVLIDKTMQWKEMSMKAKWLWTSWAYVAAASVIVLEVLWLTFAVMFLVPKFQLFHSRWLSYDELSITSTAWMASFLEGLMRVGDNTTWLLLLAIMSWGLFEWRVHSENKPFMRLSALGTLAVGLTVVSALTAGSLIIPMFVGLPPMVRIAHPFAVEQVASINTSVGAIERSLTKKDWEAMRKSADEAYSASNRLRVAIAAFSPHHSSPTVAELRAQLTGAQEGLLEAQEAIRDMNADRLQTALQKFRQSYDRLREASKKPQT